MIRRALGLSLLLLLFGCAGGGGAVRASYAKDHPEELRKSSQKPSSKKSDKSSTLTKSSSSSSSSKLSSNNITKKAKPYLGVRYRYGGTTKKGFDCSGFVWRLYQDLGYTDFARSTSALMYRQGRSVSRSSTQSGDLCFFNTSGGGVSHVGIMIDNETFVHASTSKGITYTKLSNSYWRTKIIGFRRIYIESKRK